MNEHIYLTEAQKDKLREMADNYPESVCLARYAGSLMRQKLVKKVSVPEDKPARHALTDKGKTYLSEILKHPAE